MRAEGAPEFPGKRVVTEDTFLGDRSDSNSEFVRHRKEQLGSFLRQLFNRNPGEALRHTRERERERERGATVPNYTMNASERVTSWRRGLARDTLLTTGAGCDG